MTIFAEERQKRLLLGENRCQFPANHTISICFVQFT